MNKKERGILILIVILGFLFFIIQPEIIKKSPQQEHPYLFFNNQELQDLKSKAQDNSNTYLNISTKQMFDTINSRAKAYLTNPSYSYTLTCLEGGSINWNYTFSNQTPPRRENCSSCCPWTTISDDLENRLFHISFAYSITENETYLNKTKDYLLGISNWERWADIDSYSLGNKSTNLETYSLMNGISFAYDLVYNNLTQEKRQFIEQALLNKGILPTYNDSLRYNFTESFVLNGHATQAGALGLSSLAIYNINNDSELWLNKSINKTKEFFDMQEDLGLYEGHFYGGLAVDYLLKLAISLNKTKNINLLDSTLKDRYKFLLDQYYNKEFANINDANKNSVLWSDTLFYYLGVNENAAWLNNELENYGKVFGFIWFQPNINLQKPNYNSVIYNKTGYATLRIWLGKKFNSFIPKSRP